MNRSFVHYINKRDRLSIIAYVHRGRRLIETSTPQIVVRTVCASLYEICVCEFTHRYSFVQIDKR